MISLVPLYLLLTVSARSAQAAAISRDQGPTATFYPSSGSGEGISVQGASQNGLDQYLKIPYAQPRESPNAALLTPQHLETFVSLDPKPKSTTRALSMALPMAPRVSKRPATLALETLLETTVSLKTA